MNEFLALDNGSDYLQNYLEVRLLNNTNKSLIRHSFNLPLLVMTIKMFQILLSEIKDSFKYFYNRGKSDVRKR